MARVCIATIAPNVTIPVWSRLFKKSVSPVIDEARFTVGSPIGEMRDLAQLCCGPLAELEVLTSYQSHGHALDHLLGGLRPDDKVLVIEDDCYLGCAPWVIEQCFDKVRRWEVVGSRHARVLEKGNIIGGDTWGGGLYPNMLFARVDALGTTSFVSERGWDIGGLLGEAVHARGLHRDPEAHLRQNRLSRYSGCVPVEPANWDGTWLHIGEMSSTLPMWTETSRGGHPEAVAAYAACLESGECHPGSDLERAKMHIGWAESSGHPHYTSDWYHDCKALVRRVIGRI